MQNKKNSNTKKIEKNALGKKGMPATNSECFSAPSESYLQDFDFEKNLALFNKQEVFRKIETDFPDLSLECDPSCRSEPKFRHDENILQPGESTTGGPATIQQIEVPGGNSQLYYTGT